MKQLPNQNNKSTVPRGQNKGKRLLTKLKEVKIHGPEDFAANIDLYLSGEKRIDDNLH